ncbi:putative bifunctional diguanylate cyclase/phosphodiesterase [Roseicyclus marinus]|uniref:putative bifunctional diguanylate cyclase/phosphodiesterase n=2 Tax=Roseicyclus marinus TaxID=2161673 RepID=UPI00360C7FB2
MGILALCTLFAVIIIERRAENRLGQMRLSGPFLKPKDGLVLGLVFGSTCAVLVLSAHQTGAGSVVDARAAPAILSGILGGPVAGLVAALVGGLARYYVGGPFAVGGSLSIGAYALAGFFLGRLFKLNMLDDSLAAMPKVILIAIICTVLITPAFFVDQPFDVAFPAFKTVFPILVLQNIFGTALLGGTLLLLFRSIQNRKRLLHAIEALPEAFVIYDADDRLVICNKRYREVYGNSAASMQQGMKFETILRFGLANGQYLDGIGREEEWLAERLERHRNPTGPVEQSLPNNEFVQVHEVRTDDGETVGFRTNITLLKRQQQRLEHQAASLREKAEELSLAKQQSDIASRTDELTGLGNRRGLNRKLVEFADRLTPDKELCVLLIDLDHFNAINDLFGHVGGDHVLNNVARILEQSAPPDAYVARSGSDEFIIAMLREKDDGVAAQTAQAIIDACDKPFVYEGKELRYGASIGITITQNPGCTSLIENADIALRSAKRSGRRQYRLFSQELRSEAEHKKWMVDELSKAIAEGAILPHFQPQVSSANYGLVGVEALARWHHPTKGWIPPDVFIPLAEEFGLLARIERIIARDSIMMVQRLKADGIDIPKLSINVSVRAFETTAALGTLEELKPWPCRIAFELLETVDYTYDYKQLGPLIQKIRAGGVEIELDDFGSGHASLTTLLNLRPDRIKLDRMLVASLDSHDIGVNPLVRSITEMCLRLKIPMTAEGVEKENQALALAALGCDAFQGFIFAPALPEQDLRDWITNMKTNGLSIR